MRFDMIVKKFFFMESLSNENRFLWAKDVLMEFGGILSLLILDFQIKSSSNVSLKLNFFKFRVDKSTGYPRIGQTDKIFELFILKVFSIGPLHHFWKPFSRLQQSQILINYKIVCNIQLLSSICLPIPSSSILNLNIMRFLKKQHTPLVCSSVFPENDSENQIPSNALHRDFKHKNSKIPILLCISCKCSSLVSLIGF